MGDITSSNTRNVQTEKKQRPPQPRQLQLHLSVCSLGYLGQVVLASAGHRERHRDVLPVDVLLVSDAQDLFQLGKVPLSFVDENNHKRKQENSMSGDFSRGNDTRRECGEIHGSACIGAPVRFPASVMRQVTQRRNELQRWFSRKEISASPARTGQDRTGQQLHLPSPRPIPCRATKKQESLMGGGRPTTEWPAI